MDVRITDLFDLNECFEREIFDGLEYPWEALPRIKTFLLEFAKTLPSDFEQIAKTCGSARARLSKGQ